MPSFSLPGTVRCVLSVGVLLVAEAGAVGDPRPGYEEREAGLLDDPDVGYEGREADDPPVTSW
jgi:hypothetical protein